MSMPDYIYIIIIQIADPIIVAMIWRTMDMVSIYICVDSMNCLQQLHCSVAGWQVADSSWRHDPLELVKGVDDLQIRMKLRCGSMCQCGYGLESLEPKVSQHISTAGEDLKILTWSILIMEFSPLLGVALTCRSTCHQGRRLVKAKKRQRLRKMVFGVFFHVFPISVRLKQ